HGHRTGAVAGARRRRGCARLDAQGAKTLLTEFQEMKRPLAAGLAVGLLVAASTAGAQNLVVTNARILDGAGGDIANGTIVVEGGVIRSVAAGRAPAGAANVVDAGGRTV